MSGSNLLVPLGFSKVVDGIYRSAYPADKTLPFIKNLKLKSMICLCSNDLKSGLTTFTKDNSINILECDLKFNQEPFLVMSETEMERIVTFLMSPENQPVLIFCTNGKVRTGCVVGCLRRQLGWSLASVVSEFEQFTEPEGSLSDLHFIENFQIVKTIECQHVKSESSSSPIDI